MVDQSSSRVRAEALRKAGEHRAVQQGSGTHLGRLLAAQGHEVRLISPEYVRPYVKAHKNDERDAEAMAEAATRPTMRFVQLKGAAQLDVQTLHRARGRLTGARTALINQLGAILLERGIPMPQGRRKLQRQLSLLLEQDGGLPISSRMMALVEDMRAQWAELGIGALDDEMVQSARSDETARCLISIPGIGALNATALLAAIGDGGTFARARDLAAWLGLVPRHVTTGGRPRLVGITKRGQLLSTSAADSWCAPAGGNTKRSRLRAGVAERYDLSARWSQRRSPTGRLSSHARREARVRYVRPSSCHQQKNGSRPCFCQ
jgi:transposase